MALQLAATVDEALIAALPELTPLQGQRVALTVVPEGEAAPSTARVTLGALRGQIRIRDDFDAPLPDDVLDAFEGK